MAAHLGSASEGTERIQKNFRDLAVDVTEIGIVHIGTLSFNHVKMAEINLAPLSQALGANVDGVLGNDVLQALTLKVSYSRQQIFVGPLQSLGPLGKPETLLRSGNQFLIAATFMSVPGHFVLDTGTNSTNLSWKTWEHLSQTWTPAQVVQGIQRAGNPTSSAILICLPTIKIGDVVLKDQAVRAQSKSDSGAFSAEDFDGILGSDLLQQFEITFDLRNSTVYFRPDADYRPDPYRYVTIGIQIGKTPQASSKSWVYGRTHQRRKLASKQAILSMRSAAIPSTLTLDQVSRQLHAREGTIVRLRIDRNSHPSHGGRPNSELVVQAQSLAVSGSQHNSRLPAVSVGTYARRGSGGGPSALRP